MPTITITSEQRFNLLVSALEGGSNYWYYLHRDAINTAKPFRQAGDSLVGYIWKAIEANHEIPVRDIESPEEVLGKISLASIERGEQLMAEKYPEHFADIVAGNDDATTGDIWFQLAVMGELVYG
jgi:hypothetical protein